LSTRVEGGYKLDRLRRITEEVSKVIGSFCRGEGIGVIEDLLELLVRKR
jgi:hypothetical protein